MPFSSSHGLTWAERPGQTQAPGCRRPDFALFKKISGKTLTVTVEPQSLKSENPQQTFVSFQLEKEHRPGFRHPLSLSSCVALGK